MTIPCKMLLNKGVLTNLKSLRQIDKGSILLANLLYIIFTTPPPTKSIELLSTIVLLTKLKPQMTNLKYIVMC